jgi:hypothetical protein
MAALREPAIGTRSASAPIPAAEAAAWLIAGAGLSSLLAGLHPVLCCDSQGYYDLSQALLALGPSAVADNIRTYGYPSFLAGISGLAPRPIETVHALAAAVQGALIGAAALLVRRWALRSGAAPGIALAAGVGVLLQPVLLARGSELLTDLLSAVLLWIALLPLLAPRDERDETRRAAASVLAASAAAAVRPSNVIFLALLGAIWLWRARTISATSRPKWFAAVALAALLPLAPQIAVNGRYAGTLDPFPMSGQYRGQVVWGMRYLKYGTYVESYRSPFRVYRNPFYDPAWKDSAAFFRESPAGFLATLGVHAFAFVDQDTLFTYATRWRPWYRWPVWLVSEIWLLVAGVGAFCALLGRGPCRDDAALREAGVWSAVFCGVTGLFYLPTLIETRFATPILLFGAPLTVIGLMHLRSPEPRGSPGRLARAAVGAAVLLALAAALSAWIESHAGLGGDPRHGDPTPLEVPS